MIKSVEWNFKPNRTDEGFSLEPIKEVLKAFDNPQEKIPFPIHIVGTNGKGSTTAFLEAILLEAGFKSNVYTSPNLIYLNERIKVENMEIEDETFLQTLSYIPQKISFFEALTAVAFILFAKSKADFSIIEAGLGGRFDATNIINSRLCILTSVSFDHTHILGSTIRQIASEKLAVEKSCPFVIAKQNFKEVYELALKCKMPLIYGKDYEISLQENGFTYTSKRWEITLPLPALRGIHQMFNAGAVLRAIEEINFTYKKISESAIKNGLKSAVWRARFQNLKGKMLAKFPHLNVFLDGAHNEEGVKVCLEEALKLQKPLFIICGFLKRKELENIIPQFKGFNVYSVNIHSSEEAYTSQYLASALKEVEANVISSCEFFYEVLEQIKTPASVVIMGSLYLAGEVLEWQNL